MKLDDMDNHDVLILDLHCNSGRVNRILEKIKRKEKENNDVRKEENEIPAVHLN